MTDLFTADSADSEEEEVEVEEQISVAQTLRLHALDAAVTVGHLGDADGVIQVAEKFEKYLVTGQIPTQKGAIS